MIPSLGKTIPWFYKNSQIQICQGVSKLWSNIKTNRRTNRDYYFIKMDILLDKTYIFDFYKDVHCCN